MRKTIFQATSMMQKHKSSFKSKLILQASVAVFAATFCTAILFFLKPWPDDDRYGEIVSRPEQSLLAAYVSAPEDESKNSSAAIKLAAQQPAIPERGRPALPARPERAEAISETATTDSQDAIAEITANEIEGDDPTIDAAPTLLPSSNKYLSKKEADKLLKPLLDYTVPESELEALKKYILLCYADKFTEARSHLNDIKDPVAVKLARWYAYRAGTPDSTAAEIDEFRSQNPLWPSRETLEQRAEDAIFWREPDAQKIFAYFQERRPMSGAGKAALGGALLELGRKEEGEALIREAWRKHVLTGAIEKKIRKDHGKALRKEDHRYRADWLLMQDKRSHLAAVKRLLPLIESKWKPSLKARIATVSRAKNAGTLLTNLDNKIKLEPPVLLARIQWLRRAGNEKKVWSLLRSAPKSSAKLIDSQYWWKEREPQIREALNKGHPKTAYAIAKEHGGDLPPEDLSDAEFLAGWVALQFLDKPEAAKEHFLKSAAAGGLPKMRSRANYWLGRTELALKDEAAATARFAEAAQHNHTFYGQLAHQMIDADSPKLALRTYVRPTESEIKKFVERDVMKAVLLAKKADLTNLVPVFFNDLARTINSAPEMILAAEFAERIAEPNETVRMAKIAINRSFPVEHYAYPDALPKFEVLAKDQDVDAALLHALTRQESEFNSSIVSHAGAVGLMQLLPSTAKEVAGWHNVKFVKKKLSTDPAYNVSLGSAFLHRLVTNYDGSYIMALAGYNAGPGRVRQWVKLFGDPRKKGVDPIDWVERIPFTETRGYVHKIMESVQVYRTRLQQDHAALMLAQDLHRGRKDRPQFMSAGAAN